MNLFLAALLSHATPVEDLEISGLDALYGGGPSLYAVSYPGGVGLSVQRIGADHKPGDATILPFTTHLFGVDESGTLRAAGEFAVAGTVRAVDTGTLERLVRGEWSLDLFDGGAVLSGSRRPSRVFRGLGDRSELALSPEGRVATVRERRGGLDVAVWDDRGRRVRARRFRAASGPLRRRVDYGSLGFLDADRLLLFAQFATPQRPRFAVRAPIVRTLNVYLCVADLRTGRLAILLPDARPEPFGFQAPRYEDLAATDADVAVAMGWTLYFLPRRAIEAAITE